MILGAPPISLSLGVIVTHLNLVLDLRAVSKKIVWVVSGGWLAMKFSPYYFGLYPNPKDLSLLSRECMERSAWDGPRESGSP